MFNNYCFILSSILCLFCCRIQGFRVLSSHLQSVDDDLLLSSAQLFLPKKFERRIAIIGAGSAGASTAYHLRQFANKAGFDVNITVFEKNSYIGGRATTVNVYNDSTQPTELGSALFVEANTILKNATEKFNLTLGSITYDDSFGVWNGHDIIFTQESDTSPSWDRLKLILKYGLDPLKTEHLKKKALTSFQKLYEYPYFPFKSLTSTIYELGLNSTTNVTGIELLKNNKIQGPYINEIIEPSTRVAYGQSPYILNGFQTLISLAVEGAISVKGGNQKIFDEMIKFSNSSTFLNTSVKNISTSSLERGYNITWLNWENKTSVVTEVEHFDTVVLTTPIQFSNISFQNATIKSTPKVIPYVQLHVTLFTSPHRLNPTFFNIAENKPVPSTILTTLSSRPPKSGPPKHDPPKKGPPKDGPGHPPPSEFEESSGSPGFLSISKIRNTTNPSSQKPEFLYKIFSLETVSAKLLSGLLNTTVATNFTTSNDTITWYHSYVWEDAYPYGYPRDKFDEPELARDLWYTSGIEGLASTLETSALAGMNVARLIVDEYKETIKNRMQSFMVQPTQPNMWLT